jgi:hypothetical protein
MSVIWLIRDLYLVKILPLPSTGNDRKFFPRLNIRLRPSRFPGVKTAYDFFFKCILDDAEIQKHIDRLKNENSVTSSDCQDLSVFNIPCDKVADYYIRVLKTSMCVVPQIASRCCASCSGPGHDNRR